MKWLGFLLALGSFCLFDVVVFLACCNMVQWTAIDTSLLWLLLLGGLAGMATGLIILNTSKLPTKG